MYNKTMEEEESIKPQRNGGYGKLKGASDGIPFSADNQPSGQMKSAGKKKAKLLKDLLAISTYKEFGSEEQNNYRRLTSEYLGIQEEQIDIQMIMHFRQIQKAISKSDTYAYTAVMDRAFGKPKQQTEITGKDGQTLQPAAPIFQIINTGIPLAESEDQIS